MRTTERLVLRPFRDEDLPEWAAINADPEVMRYLGGEPLSRAESDEIAAGVNRQYADEGIGFLAIERLSDGAFVGAGGLTREAWHPGEIELGWRLARAHWGRGYASEAASSWLEYAFTELELPRVIATTDAPNLRSIAVMRRLGMTFGHATELVEDGVPFEAVVYSITSAAWFAGHR